jgi:hypothetical protein
MHCFFMDKWSVIVFLVMHRTRVYDKLTARPKQLKDEDTAGSAFENEEEVRWHQFSTKKISYLGAVSGAVLY